VLSILLLQHNHFAVEWLQGFFPGVKAGEAWSWPLPSTAEVKDQKGHNSTPPTYFPDTDRDNLTFYLPEIGAHNVTFWMDKLKKSYSFGCTVLYSRESSWPSKSEGFPLTLTTTAGSKLTDSVQKEVHQCVTFFPLVAIC
jgi:hypothetical protein